ncbi:MAG: leucine-rich repeat protein [Bacillota bacterium]|jgi:uncharacterized repeat protein (TIGR02543 family)|nr:leucine-rich repeat protein [Bacillota bacterium]HHU43282.1 leucine-rich repeat protein [Clostridiales bacterium]
MRKRALFCIAFLAVLVICLTFAGCDRTPYKIHFETNGSTPIESIKTDGKSMVDLPMPTMQGYIFVGWFYDNHTFREQFTKTSLIKNPIKEDITIYAKWEVRLEPTPGLVYQESQDGFIVSGYEGDDKDIVIPSTHYGLPLVAIAEEAFLDKEIESVIIPNSVAQIGEGAFKGCDSLKKITLPFIGKERGLSKTYDSVFGYIFGYTDDFFEGLFHIRQYYDMENSLYYYIPSSLEEVIVTQTNRLPYGAFYNCRNIKKIELPKNLARIEEKAFYNCSNLGYIIIHDSIAQIDRNAFENSPEVTIYCQPQSKPSLWSKDWVGEENIVYWGIDPLDIGELDGLQYLITDNNIEITRYFGEKKEINVPAAIIDRTVVAIRTNAFKKVSLEKAILPDTLQRIGFSAFAEAKNLIELTLPFTGSGSFETHFGYIFGASSSSIHLTYIPKSLKKVKVSKGKTIAESAFLDCAYIEEIVLPESLEKIEKLAFSNCLALSTIKIPQSVNDIGENAFQGCEALRTIALPKQLSSMGGRLFYNCTNLTNVTLPQNIKILPSFSFYGCESLETIELPAGLKEIGESAFEKCQNLKNMSLPQTMEKIDRRAFNECIALEEINIPDGLIIIGDKVFENCTSLESIYIPFSVTSIGVWAFRECGSLTIYAQRKESEQPSGWVDQWNISGCPIVWDYSQED